MMWHWINPEDIESKLINNTHTPRRLENRSSSRSMMWHWINPEDFESKLVNNTHTESKLTESKLINNT